MLRIDADGRRPSTPTYHEAVEHLPAADDDAAADDGAESTLLVEDVLRAGYRWQGQVIRPAMVCGCEGLSRRREQPVEPAPKVRKDSSAPLQREWFGEGLLLGARGGFRRRRPRRRSPRAYRKLGQAVPVPRHSIPELGGPLQGHNGGLRRAGRSAAKRKEYDEVRKLGPMSGLGGIPGGLRRFRRRGTAPSGWRTWATWATCSAGCSVTSAGRVAQAPEQYPRTAAWRGRSRQGAPGLRGRRFRGGDHRSQRRRSMPAATRVTARGRPRRHHPCHLPPLRRQRRARRQPGHCSASEHRLPPLQRQGHGGRQAPARPCQATARAS